MEFKLTCFNICIKHESAHCHVKANSVTGFTQEEKVTQAMLKKQVYNYLPDW